MQYKKMLSGMLTVAMLTGTVSPILAAGEIPVPSTSDKEGHRGENNVPVTLEVLQQNKPLARFSVTVPTALPLVMDLSGNIATATNARVQNNSSDDVVVTDVRLSSSDGWKIVPYADSISDKPSNTKELGMRINGCDTVDGGLAFNQDGFPMIQEGTALPVEYSALIPRQRVASNVGTVANSVFVIGWADPTVEEPMGYHFESLQDAIKEDGKIYVQVGDTITLNAVEFRDEVDGEPFWSCDIPGILQFTENADGRCVATVVGSGTTNLKYTKHGVSNQIEVIATANYPTEIKVVQKPSKTEYVEGDTFDPSGLQLQVSYGDGTTKVITEGFSVVNGSSLTKNQRSIQINYEEVGRVVSTKVSIRVYKKVPPAKVHFYVDGKEFGAERLSMTWGEFIDSEYNPGCFSSGMSSDGRSRYVSYNGRPIYHKDGYSWLTCYTGYRLSSGPFTTNSNGIK